MFRPKSPDEIVRIGRAGDVVARALSVAADRLVAGASTGSIDAEIAAVLSAAGGEAVFQGTPGRTPYPAVSCISINDQALHAIPADRRLADGDLVSVDTGCRLGGWCADAAWSWGVGDIDEEARALLAAGRGALERAIEELGHGGTWSRVAAAVRDDVAGRGFTLVSGPTGHGIGRALHEDPLASWAQDAQGDFEITPGLVLAVEPLVTSGDGRLRREPDGWTLSTVDGQRAVHFEQTVAITGDGPRLLTSSPRSDPMAAGASV